MKTLVFDTGPIISLTTNNLLWLLAPLKQKFGGKFAIPEIVKAELIDKPLITKKFKFEALQVAEQIKSGILEVISAEKIRAEGELLEQLANNTFIAGDTPMQIIHGGEAEGIAAAIMLESVLAIDERITRLLIENPSFLARLLAKRLHTKIKTNQENLKQFQLKTKGLQMIRSSELVTVAYEMGMLDKYVTDMPDAKRALVESVLWGVKLHGCAISEDEINEILKIEKL